MGGLSLSNGLSRKDLRPFQAKMIDHIYGSKSTILVWEPGSGKSVAALTAADDLLEDGVVSRVLIVAPMLVAQATYPDEVSDWRHLNHLDYVVLRAEDVDDDVCEARAGAYKFAREVLGLNAREAASFAGRRKTLFKEAKRRKLASTKAEIHIINKQGLNWLWKFHDERGGWPYDMLIVDDTSAFKNAKRRTEKRDISQFGVLAKARKYAKRILIMNGTPAPKGLLNLWGLAYVADGGERLGTSLSAYKARWFDRGYNEWDIKPKPHAEAEITSLLSDIMFSLPPEDRVKLPPMVVKPVKVKLDPDVMREYRRFEKTLVSEAYDVEAVNNGVLASKLLQFANGSMYQDTGKDVWVHDEKLHALEEIVETSNGAPVLVVYSFKFDLDRILKRFPKAVVFGKGDVRKNKADWNAGRIQMLLTHPASAGHGQNLQFGGNINVWYGLTPDLELYQQMNKRLHRPGQKNVVTNYHIVTQDTYDEELLPLLKGRAKDQDSITSRLVKRFMELC